MRGGDPVPKGACRPAVWAVYVMRGQGTALLALCACPAKRPREIGTNKVRGGDSSCQGSR